MIKEKVKEAIQRLQDAHALLYEAFRYEREAQHEDADVMKKRVEIIRIELFFEDMLDREEEKPKDRR